MPIYVYEREDGTRFEEKQSIKDPKLTHCPNTGQPVKRVIVAGPVISLKGGGWAKDGYSK